MLGKYKCFCSRPGSNEMVGEVAPTNPCHDPDFRNQPDRGARGGFDGLMWCVRVALLIKGIAHLCQTTKTQMTRCNRKLSDFWYSWAWGARQVAQFEREATLALYKDVRSKDVHDCVVVDRSHIASSKCGFEMLVGVCLWYVYKWLLLRGWRHDGWRREWIKHCGHQTITRIIFVVE